MKYCAGVLPTFLSPCIWFDARIDHVARPHRLGFAVVARVLQLTFADQHELRIAMLVRGMRLLARRQESLVQFDKLARRQCAVHHRPLPPAIDVRRLRQRVEAEHLRLRHVDRVHRLRLSSGRH